KSHNYLRFILHAYLYVFGVADANGDTFPDELHERIKKALNYLISVCDKKSGRVPNFGSNDGALIFSVNSCDFRDFRPVINALHFYYYKTTWFEQGIWNEDLIWLFGANAAKAVVDKTKVSQNKPAIKRFDTGGIYVLNTKDTWAFIHAESYRDRPAHADALSVDLWWKGQNICIDPGTYLYYGKSPWLDAFKHTRYHNTMTVDGADQMKRAYRFTWGYWHDCEVVATKETAFFRYMTFSHNGYHRLSSPVTHQRTVLSLEDSYWVIIDDLLGEGTHEFLLHWLIHSFPSQAIEDGINLETPAGNYQLRILNASSEINVFSGLNHTPTLAKQSNYYGSLEDAIAVVCEEKQKLPIRRITLLGEDLSKAKYQAGANAMILLDEKTKISLHTVQMGKVIREVFINQSTNSDRLIKTTFN
ncbi:MAG: heparinase II/III-family protein, partial [Bacteroidota bacterium]